MKLAVLSFVLFALFTNTVSAQQARSKRYLAPLSGQVTLGDVTDNYNVKIFSKEIPEPETGVDLIQLHQIKEQITKKYPRHTNIAKQSTERTTSIPGPLVAIHFATDTFGGTPPDNCAAVSKGNKLVAVMNDAITIYDAVRDSFIRQLSLESFSVSTGLTSVLHDYRYDPKVVYDPIADRFICIMLNSTNQFNDIVLAFSQTNDPNGAWKFYVFGGNFDNDTTWFDYPAIAITQNEVFFTGNKIKYDSSWQAGFKESVIYQVRKQDGYSGSSAVSYRIWDSVTYNGHYLRCLYPLNPADTILGPSQYFLSNRDFDTLNDSLFLVQVPDTIGSADSTLSVNAIVSSLSYGVPPDALQTDTAVALATNDGRVLGGFIKDNEIQFVSESVNPLTGNSAIYHGIISNFSTSPVLTASMYGIDTLDFGYPNISYTGNTGTGNQCIISFEYSGANTYPGFGAVFYDGTAYSNMTVVHSGISYINRISGKEQRWGDYSGSQPNWNAIGCVWVEGLFGSASHNYEDYFAELASPYFTGVAKQNIPIRPTGKLYPDPAKEMVRFEFSTEKEQQYSFMIYDMQGRQVVKLADKVCNAGYNVIQFNIRSFKTGMYLLQAIGNDGSITEVSRFMKE